jgi:hypothetical protein
MPLTTACKLIAAPLLFQGRQDVALLAAAGAVAAGLLLGSAHAARLSDSA